MIIISHHNHSILRHSISNYDHHKITIKLLHYQEILNLPRVVGTTDGTHIPIKKPKDCNFHITIAKHTLSDMANDCIQRKWSLNKKEKKNNYALSVTRSSTEHTFTFLKGRFRRWKYLDMKRTDFAPVCILAFYVLHMTGQ
ncbi:uncharacterized protein LOC111086892 [Limulus polyphemus]|uniref:Uncharacterized protein LOC111086892 n=1 Tax=Limulus polyphemus TaxID=6850 RepID=A0ABM1SUI8_LIMPO|nr:uncharacterized protein LOC111086892 [Limulus polyphemus]